MDSDNPCFGSNSIPGCLLARRGRRSLCVGKYYFLVLIEKAQKGLYKRLNVPYSLYIRKREREASSPPVQLEFGIGEEFFKAVVSCGTSVVFSPRPSLPRFRNPVDYRKRRQDMTRRNGVWFFHYHGVEVWGKLEDVIWAMKVMGVGR